MGISQKSIYAITIIPATAIVDGLPGQTKIHKIHFINNTKFGCSVSVNATDISFNTKGIRVFTPPGRQANSISKNIKISPESFELKSGEDKDIVLNIKIPQSLKGSDDSMIFFTATPTITDIAGKKSKLSIETSLGSLVMIGSINTKIIKSKIKNVEINYSSKNKPLNFNMEVLNTGNCHIEGSAIVAIFNDKDKFISTFNIHKRIIYPGQKDLMTGEWKGRLDKGQYHALVTYQYGEDKNIVIDRVFNIK